MRFFLASEGMLLIFARVLETLFIVGIIGSLVVVALTFIEDIRDVGPEEEGKAKRAEAPARALVGESTD